MSMIAKLLLFFSKPFFNDSVSYSCTEYNRAYPRFAFYRYPLLLLCCLPHLGLAQSQTAPPTQTKDVSHYAFANYLGSGVYRTAEQSAAVINIPLSFELKRFYGVDHDETTANSTEPPQGQLFLRLPMSFGFFNYDFNSLPRGDIPSNVGTLVVTPGLEYHWQGADRWRYEVYADLGYGVNFSNDNQVSIFSMGISALYDIDLPNYSPTWINRLYYAGYRNKLDHNTESFSVLSSGIESGINQQWRWGTAALEPRLFLGTNWYFDKLKFSSMTKAETFTNYSVELGFSLLFAKPVGWELLDIKRAGLSYQFGEGLRVIKFHLDFPL
ncbi:hypothetical protein [Shewanella sp. SR44-3]|uniref:hypothetical protein n=1 Tax=unclassified Shewanella TaxID=196818 RepID=UPI0015F9DCBD|nr:hypothetical protein [Shewanella sp. SR44-3]MBB1269922.1 hypothetical protein [Shewanella sp. SR44-3]